MEPSLKTLKRLFALSCNRCAFPGCESPIVENTGTVTGIVCHIKARKRKGPRYDSAQTEEERHAFGNLILMCARHSKQIDSEPQRFTVETLLDVKDIHERGGGIELGIEDSKKVEALLESYRSIHVHTKRATVGNADVIHADTVHLKSSRSKVVIAPMEGTVASDRLSRNYVKHLIDRYHEFAKEQPGRSFVFSAIYSEIKKKFGAKWDHVPLNRLPSLVVFLQARIDNTMLGRINGSKGHRNYSTLEEYQLKYDEGE